MCCLEACRLDEVHASTRYMATKGVRVFLASAKQDSKCLIPGPLEKNFFQGGQGTRLGQRVRQDVYFLVQGMLASFPVSTPSFFYNMRKKKLGVETGNVYHGQTLCEKEHTVLQSSTSFAEVFDRNCLWLYFVYYRGLQYFWLLEQPQCGPHCYGLSLC